MTVVANLVIEGVPVLIGDTVITSGDLSEKSTDVPTVKALPQLRRPITGFCRKVYIIEKKLAVAWTGSRLKAEQLIPGLRQHMRSRWISESNLQNFLALYHFPQQGGGELRLIGWIAEHPAPRAFWWSSDEPTSIVYDDPGVEGSGRDIFDKTFFDRDAAFRGTGLTTEEHVFMACLAGISRLLTLETQEGLTLTKGFGFCYDIVAWAGYRFKYIKSYTQIRCPITYDWRARTVMHHGARSPTLVYNSLGNHAAFWAVRHDPLHEVEGLDTPVIIRSVAHQGQVPAQRPQYRSRYFCASLEITDQNGVTFTVPYCITDATGPDDAMWLSNRTTYGAMEMKATLIEELYDVARRIDYARRNPGEAPPPPRFSRSE